jgi:hypothetical protein
MATLKTGGTENAQSTPESIFKNRRLTSKKIKEPKLWVTKAIMVSMKKNTNTF